MSKVGLHGVSFLLIPCNSYSAPELVEGKPYDAQIDDWSIGAILYFLLTSRHAFALEGAEDEDTQKLVLSGNYDTSNPLWPEVSSEGECSIMKSYSIVSSVYLTFAALNSQEVGSRTISGRSPKSCTSGKLPAE